MRRSYWFLVIAAVLLVGSFIAYKASTDPHFFDKQMRVKKIMSLGNRTMYDVVLPRTEGDKVFNTGIWIAPSKAVSISTKKNTTVQPFEVVLEEQKELRTWRANLEELKTYEEEKAEILKEEGDDDLKKFQLRMLELRKDDMKERVQIFSTKIYTFNRLDYLFNDHCVYLSEEKELYLRVVPNVQADYLELT